MAENITREHGAAAAAVVSTMSPLELIAHGLHALASPNMAWEAIEGVLKLLRESNDVLAYFAWDPALGPAPCDNMFVAIEALRDARQSEPWAAVAYCGFVTLLAEVRAYNNQVHPISARRLDTPHGAETLAQFNAIVDAIICGHMDVATGHRAFLAALRLHQARADASIATGAAAATGAATGAGPTYHN